MVNKSLNYLQNKMSKDNYKRLVANQELWSKYETNTEKLLYLFVISKDGNYNSQIGYNYLANVKKQRNELLRTIYNLYSIENDEDLIIFIIIIDNEEEHIKKRNMKYIQKMMKIY